MTIARTELDDLERANKSGVTPVVLVHGLWMPAGSWLPWRGYLEEYGYATIAPRWPGELDSAEDARAHPDSLSGLGTRALVDHVAEVVAALDRTPVLIGHSLGGVIVQQLAGRGLARATVALGPSPFRGVRPLPLSTVRSLLPVLRTPANRSRSVMLSESQFRFVFGNALDAGESRRLYDELCVPAPGRPLFEAALANLDPRTPLKVDTRTPDRGPLLIVSGEVDNVVPGAISRATYRQQSRNPCPTELTEAPGRGHSFAMDAGWRVVADNALMFLHRHGVYA
jgi:non-heme chloroperoxidase